jgi:hypothetical protein
MESGRARELLEAARVSLEAAQEAVYAANEEIRTLPSTATDAEIEAAYAEYNRAVDWESVCKSTYSQAIRIAGG